MPVRNVESMVFIELAAYAFNMILFFLLSFSQLSGTATITDINPASLVFPTLFFISLWLFLRKIDPREFFRKLYQGMTERSSFLDMHLMFSFFLSLLYLSSLGFIYLDRIALPSWIFHFIQNALGMSFVFSMVLALLEVENGPKGPRKKKKKQKRLSLQLRPVFNS